MRLRTQRGRFLAKGAHIFSALQVGVRKDNGDDGEESREVFHGFDFVWKSNLQLQGESVIQFLTMQRPKRPATCCGGILRTRAFL